MGKAADNRAGFDLGRRRTFLSLFDDRREILYFAVGCVNMLTARIACGTCCPKPVLVAVLRRNDAVCGHQHRTVKALKFLFLLPPRIAVVSCEMRILFEERIIMRR